MSDTILPVPQRTRFRIAIVLAILADAIQWIFLPFFVEGAASPADDAVDAGVGLTLILLLGLQWEFLPSALAKLVPGADLIPSWTLAVANVYRRQKQLAKTTTDANDTPNI